MIQRSDKIDRISDDRGVEGNPVAKLISKFNARLNAEAIFVFAAIAMILSIFCGAALGVLAMSGKRACSRIRTGRLSSLHTGR